VVKDACSKCAMPGVAPHDLRRTRARLCHEAGGELEQIVSFRRRCVTTVGDAISSGNRCRGFDARRCG
jgi:hypothetical protein